MPFPRHEPAEIRRLLEVRRSEKLTFQQLSERSGIPTHVFTYRAAQDRREQPDSPVKPSSFVEVVAAVPLTELDAPRAEIWSRVVDEIREGSRGDLGAVLELHASDDVSEELVSVEFPPLALGGLSEP